MGEWQDIETAPTDGTPVILYGTLLTYCCHSPDRGKPMGRHVAVGTCRIGRWWVGLYECEPTHWMPLPAPPAVRNRKARA